MDRYSSIPARSLAKLERATLGNFKFKTQTHWTVEYLNSETPSAALFRMPEFDSSGRLNAKNGEKASSQDRDIIEGSLEVKLPTIWTDERQSRAEAERRERLEERRVEEKE